jgi:hypothetical protein
MGRRVMAKKLLGTTALVGGVLAGGALSVSDALAQALCPASSVTGTGNVSNAVCNAVGTPLPFTLTLNLNVTDVAAANTNAKTSAPGSGDNPIYANSGGPGHNDLGFMESGWMRFTFDAPAEGDQHYGYHMRFTVDNSQQTTVGSTSANSSKYAINNSVSHAPTNVNREWVYWKSPKWGQVQIGSEGSGIPGVFMAPVNYGPPGSAIQTLGPGTGIESILWTDVTTGQIDAGAALLGSDAMRTKGAMGIRWISPTFLGSSSDYGFTLDVKFTPDGRPYNEGNFATDSFGAGSNADLGEATTPKTYMSRVMDITEATLTWEELLAKDFDVTLAVGGVYGISKNGLNSISTPHVATAAAGDVGIATGGQKANSDLTEAVAGFSVVWRENLTIGGGLTYAGKSLYPANTPVYLANGKPNGKANPGEGASIGWEYDWDRYQIGGWYQWATDQGDMNDEGYIQLHYFGFGAGVKVLKGLKFYGEAVYHIERNNHSDGSDAFSSAASPGGAIQSGACAGGAGSFAGAACMRNAHGMLYLVGSSLDF